MICVILAGGKGRRMGELVHSIPKPMIKMDNIPILLHQINVLKRYNIKNYIITSGYKHDVIEKFFENGNKYGVNIQYHVETKPLGTAGALPLISEHLSDEFLVVYGDIIFDINCSNFIKFHKKHNGKYSVIIHPNNHPYDSDIFEIKNNKIATIHSKPHKPRTYYPNNINAGIYLLNKEVIDFIDIDKSQDFVKDIFPRLINKKDIFTYKTAEYIKDAGTPERFQEVYKDLKNGKVEKNNSDNKRPAIFLDRDGVINKSIDQLHRVKDLELFSCTIETIKKINKSNYLCIVITNQSVIARNLCSLDKLDKIHNKIHTLLGKGGAYLDDIFFCPHHPHGGYPEENKKYKKKCNCRKPNTGMVIKAQKKYNIDLESSYFIGDSINDINCGKKMNIRTIKIENSLNKNINFNEDYKYPNLYKAIKGIIT